LTNVIRARRRAAVLLAISCGALVLTASASAHAHVSPPVVLAKEGQVFTLAVPTEKDTATTSAVELTPPKGFSIDSFAAAPGWKRDVQSTGSGDSAVIQKVTWSGGKVPAGEAAMFQFLASTDKAGTYGFQVRQTYSDGSVVDWSGPESSDTPAPTISAKATFGAGGGGSARKLGIVGIALGALALVVAAGGLLARSGRRPLG
jgi:uncharacterized protein YcnI